MKTNLPSSELIRQLPGLVFVKDSAHNVVCLSQRHLDICHLDDMPDDLTDFNMPFNEHLAQIFYDDDESLLNSEDETHKKFVRYYHIEGKDLLTLTHKSIIHHEDEKMIFGQTFVLDHLSNEMQQALAFSYPKVTLSKSEIKKYIGNLSVKESECLYFLVRGYSAKEIAEAIGLAKRTVEHYIDAIKLKLKCPTKRSIIEFSHANGYQYIIPESLLPNENAIATN